MARDPWQRSDWFALASVILALIAIVITVIPPVYGWWTRTDVSFARPVDDSTTDQNTINASGSVSNPPQADRDIWLVVRPQTANRYYPIERLVLQPDDSWEVLDIPLGEVGHYQIYTYLTDSAASSEFLQHLEANATLADPPGMLTPPQGAEFLTAIDVEQLPE